LVGGIIIAFYRGADFAGVCTAFIPIMALLMGIFGARVKVTTAAKMEVVKKLGGVIEESLTAIRLIASFANEEKETQKFRKFAEKVRDVAHNQEFWSSFVVGLFKFAIFAYYVYSFYIASIYIEKGYTNPCNHYKKYDVGQLLAVLVSFMTGMMMIFGLTPNIQALI
jgi:ABC-type multidrug transport system fused ATPase/permease subunit